MVEVKHMNNSSMGIICAVLVSIVYIKFGLDDRLFFIMIVAILGLLYAEGNGKKKKG